MKVKRLFVVMILVMSLFVSLLSGCAQSSNVETSTNGNTTTSENTTTDSGELKGEITMWHSFTQGARNEKIQKAADEFMALNPGVTITLETFPWGEFYTKWTSALATGQVPDLSTALPGHVVEMIDAEAIVPINDFIDEIGRDRFFEAPIAEMTVDGNNYAVPLYSHAQVMWYRTDLLEANNLEVPKTWDELYNVAKSLTNEPDLYGLPVPMGSGDLMGTRFLNFYVRSAGETLLTEDGKANLTSKAAIDGINYWLKVYKDCSPESSVNFKVLDQAMLYYQGKAAFDFNSGFHIGGIAKNSPDLIDHIAAAPMPKININDPSNGIETSNIPLVIWKNSKSQKISKAFLKFLYEDERYIDFLHSVPGGMLPALKDIAVNEKFLAEPTIQKFEDSIGVISEAVGKGTAIGFEYGPQAEAGLLTSQNVIEQMFQDIVLKDLSVEKAAQEAEDKLNELFKTLQ